MEERMSKRTEAMEDQMSIYLSSAFFYLNQNTFFGSFFSDLSYCSWLPLGWSPIINVYLSICQGHPSLTWIGRVIKIYFQSVQQVKIFI